MDQDEKLKFLAESIANAKKVMDKVETTFDNNQITNERKPKQQKPLQQPPLHQPTSSPKMMANVSKSKMPKEILESFMENPIADPTVYGVGDLITEASKHQAKSVENISKNEMVYEESAPVLDTRLIEYIIKKTVEETIEQINKKSNIDENFQIKIGNKIFSGKLKTLTEQTKTNK